MVEDEKIIDLFFARSDLAISELDMKYGKTCHQLSYKILNNLPDAEECVNDAYFGTWNAIPPQRPHSLLAFVCVLVRRYSIMRHRANIAVKRNSSYDVAFGEIEECFASPVDVEGTVEVRLLTRTIEEFLDTLTQEKRVIFLRRYWFSDSYEQIAERTGLTVKNISVRLTRTRKQLREYLREKEVLV